MSLETPRTERRKVVLIYLESTRARWITPYESLKIARKKDFICPLSQAAGTLDLISSQDKEFLALDAGHIGLMTGPAAKNELWPRVHSWLEPRSR